MLGSDHGPVVLSIPLAVAAKERITRLVYLHAQGRLHAIRSDSPGVREAATAVLQRACDDRALKGWLSSDQGTATMGTPEVQQPLTCSTPSVTKFRGQQGCACPQAWIRNTPMFRRIPKHLSPRCSHINKPSHGGPGSYGDATQRGQGSPPGKVPPSCSMSGKQTLTTAPPSWRICEKLWINSFSSSTSEWKSSRVYKGRTSYLAFFGYTLSNNYGKDFHFLHIFLRLA